MKRIIITALVLTFFISLQAQQAATPTLNYNALKKKFDKSNENIVDEKSKIKPAVWFNRGELLQDINDVNTEFIRFGMPETEANLYLGKPTETKTNDDGQQVHVHEKIILTFSEGALVDWEETEQIHEEPLPLAFEAYVEALRLDEKGKLSSKVKKNMDRLKKQCEEEAIRNFTKGDYKKALELFELIIEVSEEPIYEGYLDSVIIYNSALAAKNAGMHEEAAQYFQRATDINYGGSDCYYLLMKEYIAIKDSTKALETLQKGFELYPDTTLILFELINYYVSSNNIEEGMKYVELAEEKAPENPSILFVKGTLYERLGKRDLGIESYLKSIEIDSTFYNSVFNLGAAYFNSAVELYDIANTKDEIEEYNKAKAIADEELKKSIAPMEKAHEINPLDRAPLETLKTIYYRLNMTEEYDIIIEKLNGM
jgi:tetratricopeptide (TPR) repeat protein